MKSEKYTVGYITGDGIGADIMPVARNVLDAAVAKAYGDGKRLVWEELLVGDAAVAAGKERLSEEAFKKIAQLKIILKGPLTTPVGEGHRSLNVAIRQRLDLYACVRPVALIPGAPSPMCHKKLDIVIFRENTEDVYTGIEWPAGSEEAEALRTFLAAHGHALPEEVGLGIKPISRKGSRRLVEAAVRYALAHGRKSVTIVHKGNIMKYTEGLFRDEGYATALAHDGVVKEGEAGKLVVKDRIADSMFQQLLLRPDEYDVLATNLNGDYLSDAAAAQVGGIGMAPGANINYETGIAVFEATHGTAPTHAGKDEANPGSLILSGAMLLEHIGWTEAARLIRAALAATVAQKTVTYDLARQMDGATRVACSAFGEAIVKNIRSS